MKLIPGKQWICDACGEIIKEAKDGYVQWKCNKETGQIEDFVIVHHKSASPRKNGSCYIYRLDSDLESFLGEHGLVELHSLVDPGEYHAREYKPLVSNLRKWLDFYKRLQLPYYEEARQYWDKAMHDGYFGDANEIYIYLPNNLKAMIEHYEDE